MRSQLIALVAIVFAPAFVACGGGNAAANGGASTGSAPSPEGTSSPATPSTQSLPLVLVRDVELPGAANRFDYQDVDTKRGRLVIAHMNDASVVVVDMETGAVAKVIPNV